MGLSGPAQVEWFIISHLISPTFTLMFCLSLSLFPRCLPKLKDDISTFGLKQLKTFQIRNTEECVVTGARSVELQRSGGHGVKPEPSARGEAL